MNASYQASLVNRNIRRFTGRLYAAVPFSSVCRRSLRCTTLLRFSSDLSVDMGSDDSSPVLNLSEVTGAQADRFKALGQFFEKKYGQPPEFYVRAPGR